MIAETHSIFNTQNPDSKDENTATFGIGRIANNVAVTIAPWSLLGYLRSGVTEYLISNGISVCHGMDLTQVNKNPDYVDMVDRDLQHGYHRKRMGSVTDDEKKTRTSATNELPECEILRGEPCLVARMFGGFTSHHRVFSLMPVKVTPVKSQYRNDVRNITGLGNFRKLTIAPRAFTDQRPYTFHSTEVIANLDAIMYIRMYENNQSYEDNQLYVAMLMRAVEYLNGQTENSNYNHQLGGSRTFGCGWMQIEFLPPDLTRDETIVHHMNLITKEEAAGNDMVVGNEENTGADEQMKGKVKTSKQVAAKFDAWQVEKVILDKLLDDEITRQKTKFGIDVKKSGSDEKWWSQKATWLRGKEKDKTSKP